MSRSKKDQPIPYVLTDSSGTKEMMTPEDAKRWVQAIKELRYDHEAAHSEEDRFRAVVLNELSREPGRVGELARLALSTDEIDFHRWCS